MKPGKAVWVAGFFDWRAVDCSKTVSFQAFLAVARVDQVTTILVDLLN